MMQNMQNKCQK